MATKPFTVDGNIVVDEATLSNSTNSLVLPAGSIITGGGTVLDATNSDTDDLTEGVTNLYFTDTRADARIALQAGSNLDLSGKSTTDLSEGTNLYYTQGRFDTAFTAKSTTDLSEGTNLYYTNARADARITAASITDLSDADQSVQTTDDVTFANITTSGYLRGPASFVIDPAAFNDDTGTVVIAGNLQVDGTQTTINSTTVAIDDLKLSVATDAADSAAANGAGITVGGANANITYTHATTSWDFDKPVNVAGNIGVTGTVDGVDIATRDAVLTSTTTTAGAALPKAGGTMTGDLQLYKATPIINLRRSDNATLPGLSWQGAGGAEAASIKMDGTGGMTNSLVMSTYNGSTMAERLRLMTNAAGGIAVTGTISVTGTVDGVDIAARDAILTSTTTTADAALPKAGGTMTGRPVLNYQNPEIRFEDSDTNNNGEITLDNTSLRFESDPDNAVADSTIKFNVDNDTKMIVLSGGNVGIGTTTPAHKLDVNGAIGVSQVRHSVRPTLNLDFANSKQLDPRITFYRDSIATYYDSKGVLRYANVNEPRFDHDPSTGESKGLLIEESRTNLNTASENFSAWTTPAAPTACHIELNSTVSPNGNFSAAKVDFTASDNHPAFNQESVSFANGADMTNSLFVKYGGGNLTTYKLQTFSSGTSNLDGYAVITFNSSGVITSVTTNANVTSVGYEDVGNGWYRVYAVQENTTGGTQTTMRISIGRGASDTGFIYIWGAQIEAGAFATSYIPSDTQFTSRSSAATYYDATGILRTAPANSPRYGYKYDGRKWVETGLILEQGSTNLALDSAMNASPLPKWAPSATTIIIGDYGLNPDNSQGNTMLVRTNQVAASGKHIRQSFTIQQAEDYTISVYAKLPSGGTNAYDFLYMRLYDLTNATSFQAWFNIDTGTIGTSQNAYSANIEDVGNGWYRCSVSGRTTTSSNTGTMLYDLFVAETDGVEGNPGDNSSGLLMWGAQLETGFTTTSFIYTTTASITRSADVASSTAYTREQDKTYLDNIDNYEWFNQDQGTIYTDITPVDHDPASSTTYFVFNLTDKTPENSITLRYGDIIGGTDVFMKSFNTVEVDLASFTSAAKSQMKAAVAYEQDNAGFSVNGETAKVDTTYRTTNLTYLALSGSEPGYFAASHYIKKLSYYPIRLNNAELQALTENN